MNNTKSLAAVLTICAAPLMCEEKTSKVPFTVITTGVYTMPDGTVDTRMPVEDLKQLTARNSSGKSVEAVRVRDYLSTPGFHWRRITDKNTGIEITAIDVLRTRETVKRPLNSQSDEGNDQLAKRHCQSGGLKFLGYESLLGVKLAHLVGENKVDNQEAWALEEAGCVWTQAIHKWKNPDGTVGGITFDRLDVLTIGEPDPALFEIPADYKEKNF